MRQVAIEDAGAQLPELVRVAQGGEEVVLTQNGAAVETLTVVEDEKPRPQFGSAKDIIV